MGYPRHLLAPEENIVIDSRPHWKALIAPSIVTVAALAIAITVGMWTAGSDMSQATITTIWIIVGVVVGVALIAWALSPFIRWSTTHFVITDRRVIFRTGVFTKSGIDIPLSRVNTVQFRHGLLDRMLGTGTLMIESASDDPLEFQDIPDVESVHARLYAQVHQTLDGEDHPPR